MESEGERKKRKEVGDDNSLDSMFEKQQTVSVLNKVRDTYNAQVQIGKEMGLEEATQTDPVWVLCRSEKDTHDIEWTETVHETVTKYSVYPKCIPPPFISAAASETSVYDVLGPQPFQDSITTDQPTVQTDCSQKNRMRFEIRRRRLRFLAG